MQSANSSGRPRGRNSGKIDSPVKGNTAPPGHRDELANNIHRYSEPETWPTPNPVGRSKRSRAILDSARIARSEGTMSRSGGREQAPSPSESFPDEECEAWRIIATIRSLLRGGISCEEFCRRLHP